MSQLDTLARQAASALHSEVKSIPVPPLDLGLIRERQIRRTVRTSVLAVVAVVLLAGLPIWLGSFAPEEPVASPTTFPASTTVPTSLPSPTPLPHEDQEALRLEPGYYSVDVDGSPSTSAGATLVIADNGWIAPGEGVNFNGDNGVSMWLKLFVEPFVPGCGLAWGAPLPSGSTAADLADAIAASGFTVLEDPAPVTAFGQNGYHVVVEVPEGCSFGGDPGITHNNGPLAHVAVGGGHVIEAWSFDIDGSIAMVEAIWRDGYAENLTESGEEDLAEVRAVIDSLVLTP
jgi:hypothetical protein